MKRRGFLLLLASLTLGGMSSLSSCKAPENEYNDKSFAYVNLDYDATLMDVKIKDAKEKYYSGDIISLEITPKDGYVFAYGLINGEVIKDITNISLPSGNTTIKLFAKLLIDNDGITNIRDFTFTQSADKKSYILSSYVPSGKMPEVCEIPDTYEDKPITEIADAAFTSASGIKGIKIGKNIEKINSKAFTNCITLTDYSVSEGNEHFSASSGALFTKDGSTLLFYAPQHAGEFTIPSGTKTISPYAFSLATGLTKINFNDDLEEIGEYAFNYCGNLIELNIPSSVKKIGNYAFNTCSLLKSVTLNEGLTSIGEYAFYKDIKLEKVNIPGSLKEVSQGAFSSCESLTNLSFAEGVETLGTQAFSYCLALKEVTLPNTLKTLGTSSFAACDALTKVTLNEGLETISNNVFNVCKLLGDVTLPSTVKSIGEDAFGACLSISKFTISDSNANFTTSLKVGETSYEGILFSKDGSTLIAYPNLYNNRATEFKIPNTVTKIAYRAFNYTSNNPYVETTKPYSLVKIFIPSSVKVMDQIVYGANIQEVEYEGTMAEFKAIKDESGTVTDSDGVTTTLYWYSGSNVKSVKCSDGTITL